MIRKEIQAPIIVLGALAIGAVSAADAQAVSIRFGGRHKTSQSLTFDGAGGLQVTATATSQGRNGHVRSASVARTRSGLGVRSSRRDRKTLDGQGLSERLDLSFSHAVRLVSATFTSVSRDAATVTVDGSEIFSGILRPRRGTHARLSFDDNTIGTVASFAPRGAYDSFFLKSVHVEKVPEPMTVLGTGLALGVGAALERRRKKSKAKAS